jgi:CubicO group peptidase (beta-lactamase class C family)
MNVEGDMLMGVTPDGLALSHGLAITRLRDLARYGMLYTPSWNKAARERIVSTAYLAELQKGGNPDAYRSGDNIERQIKRFGEAPLSFHWQWDAVFADGDLWKSGFQGQGLYVSPKRDLVVVFFSTTYNNLPGYARAIAKSLPAAR